LANNEGNVERKWLYINLLSHALDDEEPDLNTTLPNNHKPNACSNFYSELNVHHSHCSRITPQVVLQNM